MRKLYQYALALFVAYVVAWTAAYVYITYNAVNGLDFTHYFEWFVLAWTFQGLEMVGFTWLISIVLFVPLAAVSAFLVKRSGRP